jgi:hypothetical protein
VVEALFFFFFFFRFDEDEVVDVEERRANVKREGCSLMGYLCGLVERRRGGVCEGTPSQNLDFNLLIEAGGDNN